MFIQQQQNVGLTRGVSLLLYSRPVSLSVVLLEGRGSSTFLQTLLVYQTLLSVSYKERWGNSQVRALYYCI